MQNLIQSRLIIALRCLPFNLKFYRDIQEEGFSAEYIFINKHQYCLKGHKWFNKPRDVEKYFIWLIKIGLVRREVDGQGLTSRIRLTPLGRNIIEVKPYLPEQKASYIEKIKFHLTTNCLFI